MTATPTQAKKPKAIRAPSDLNIMRTIVLTVREEKAGPQAGSTRADQPKLASGNEAANPRDRVSPRDGSQTAAQAIHRLTEVGLVDIVHDRHAGSFQLI